VIVFCLQQAWSSTGDGGHEKVPIGGH
jgi:hypothetical protein